MRILWLSPTSGLLNEREGTGGYGGSGWIVALQHLLMSTINGDTLGIAFPCTFKSVPSTQDGVHYYPILRNSKSCLQKFFHYYGGYKHIDYNEYVEDLNEVIKDFHPDVIHLFGLENPFSTILGHTKKPVVVHLQGLLGPCDNAFYPQNINYNSFIWPPTVREWICRNGYRFTKKELHTFAFKEAELFKRTKFIMGRTAFDFQVSRLMSPSSRYFMVNEALRPSFYQNAGKWIHPTNKFIITSTISETVYKGLDLILKTAALLKKETKIDFEWQVVGIKETSSFVRFFEHFLSIKSRDVNVKYLGVLTAEQITEHNLASSVYVHPSYIDNSPNGVCEAQILGMPVIATNVGGVSSLIEHKVSGLLVPANASYELAYWIKTINDDSSLAASLGRNAFESAIIRHNKDTIIRDLFTAYNSIINKP
jgi:glycosyltransferase involved in cell wall biosynthesis